MNTGGDKHVFQQEHKPLGLVWVNSPSPVLSAGLESMLKGEAHVCRGQRAPVDKMPSVVVLCPGDREIESELQNLKVLTPGVPCVVFDFVVNLCTARIALRAGARGLLHAEMQASQIIRALSVVQKGEVVIPRTLLKDLVMGEEEPAVDLAVLTSRQREILEMVAQGLTNAQIAQQLFLSEFTIKQHLRAAYKQLGVRNRTEAARILLSSHGRN